MMEKINMFLFAFFLMLICVKVEAASTCSNERSMELTSLANNVNVDYTEYKVERGNDVYPELEEGETQEEPGFYIRVYNITNDLNIKITPDGATKGTVAYYKDIEEDGIIYVDAGYPGSIKNYTLSIRSNDSNCQNEVLRQITVTLPQLNYFYNFEVCRANPDYYMCQEYTTVDYSEVSDAQFLQQIQDYVQKKEEDKVRESKFWFKLLAFIKTYKGYFITIVVLALGITVFIKIRNKQRRKLV